MAAITFTPTTWVDDTTPAITAAQLNRIEAALDDVVNGGGDLDLGTNALITGGVVQSGNGSSSAPSFTFESDPNTGAYRYAADQWAVAAGATVSHIATGSYALIAGSNTTGSPAVTQAVGSAAAPGFTFVGDTDTGIYRQDANSIGFACGGDTAWMMRLANTDQSRLLSRDRTGNYYDTYMQFDDSLGRWSWYVNGTEELAVNATNLIATNVYNATTGSAANVNVDASGNVTRSTSALKYKTDVEDAGWLADAVLRPVSFRHAGDGRDYLGFIADEVAAVDGRAGVIVDGEVEDYDTRAVLAVLAAKVNRLEAAGEH